MQRWQPTAYASIPRRERETYFLQLNEAVTEAIRCREHSLMPPASVARHDHLEYVAQMNMSHLMAEAAVLEEMVLLPPEPGLASEQDEPQTDSTGAYLDEGWRSPGLELSEAEWQDRQTETEWKPAIRTERAQEKRLDGHPTS
jgi:hypothetical protein